MSVSVKARTVPGVAGPGGLNCPCCSHWVPQRDMRRIRRAIRRSARIDVRDYR